MNEFKYLSFLMASLIGCAGSNLEGSATDAGFCVANCALGCALDWAKDLPLTLEDLTEQLDDVRMRPPTPDSMPFVGNRVYLHVEGPSDAWYYLQGTLVGPALLVGDDHWVARLRLDGGVAVFVVLLGPTPRLYVASLARAPNAIDLPTSYVPSTAPRSLAEFRRRFGPLPTW